MITFLSFSLGLTIGILLTMVFIAKIVGWIDLIVKEERKSFTKTTNEKIELL